MKEDQNKVFHYKLESSFNKDFTPIEQEVALHEIELKSNLEKNNINQITNTQTININNLNEIIINKEPSKILHNFQMDISETDQNNLTNNFNLEFLKKQNHNSINSSYSQKINYSQFIEKIGITKKANQVYFLANFLQFIWGMEACFIAINIERLASNRGLSINTKAVLISILYAMLGFGSALMGHLTKLIGRIKLIVFSSISYCIFVLLCSFPFLENFYVIFGFRCIANISLGIFNVSIINLLTEYLPIKRRSYVLMMNSGMYNVGNIFLIIVNNIFLADMNKNFDINSWRIINLLCVIPGLLSLILSIFYVEESPIYLINNQNNNEKNSEKAFKILKEMCDANKTDFNERIFKSIEENARSLESFKLKSTYSELFYSNYARLTICNIFICTICYMNMVGISYVL